MLVVKLVNLAPRIRVVPRKPCLAQAAQSGDFDVPPVLRRMLNEELAQRLRAGDLVALIDWQTRRWVELLRLPPQQFKLSAPASTPDAVAVSPVVTLKVRAKHVWKHE